MLNIHDIFNTLLSSAIIRPNILLPIAKAEHQMLFLLTKIKSQHNEILTRSLKLHQLSINHFITYKKCIAIESWTKNINTQKMKLFQQNTISVFSTWPLVESDIISYLMLNPSS